VLLACAASHLSFGQFGPFVTSVANSASYSPVLAQGSIFVAFGYNLAPGQLQQAASYPLPSQISGTSIKISSGGLRLTCPMFYVSYSQVAAVLPSNAPLGQADLVITANGRSNSFSVEVAPSAFGMYTLSSSGLGPGVVTGVDYGVKTSSQPARPG
jgi:uncharacterized protein (TIGR03437 family)